MISQSPQPRFTGFDMGANAIHALDQFSHHFQGRGSRIPRGHGGLLGRVRVMRHGIDIPGHLFDIGGRAVDRFALFFRATGDFASVFFQLLRAGQQTGPVRCQPTG